VAAVFNLPAVVHHGLVTALLVVGIKGIRRGQRRDGFDKVTVVGVVIAVGVFFTRAWNLHPFIPDNSGTFGEYGWSGIMRGAAVTLLLVHRL
jgi:APA family basic amino acid/polyamine antiporter